MDLSTRDVQAGLNYVALSRVMAIQGLMLDAPFDRAYSLYGGTASWHADEVPG